MKNIKMKINLKIFLLIVFIVFIIITFQLSRKTKKIEKKKIKNLIKGNKITLITYISNELEIDWMKEHMLRYYEKFQDNLEIPEILILACKNINLKEKKFLSNKLKIIQIKDSIIYNLLRMSKFI